jgi:hypothetical protein
VEITGESEVEAFQVYGDNLLECFKFCEMIAEGGARREFELVERFGSQDAPVFVFEDSGSLLGLLPCGRYRDWSEEKRPYIGQEASDIILCHAEQADELGQPVLGVEFNEAVTAGNQAWQRFPRIAQAAERGVPYVYTVPVVSGEVNEGELRSLRHPNVIITLGQFALMARYGVPSFTVFSNSGWFELAKEREGISSDVIEPGGWRKQVADAAIFSIRKATQKDTSDDGIDEDEDSAVRSILTDMHSVAREFIDTDFTVLSSHDFISGDKEDIVDSWVDHILRSGDIPESYRFFEWSISDFLEPTCSYNKATSTESKFKDEVNPKMKINSSATKSEIQDFADFWGIEDVTTNLTKNEMKELLWSKKNALDLPLSYKNRSNEIGVISNIDIFIDVLSNTYDLDRSTKSLLDREESPYLFLPIAGYVQDTGGPAFSRPDKGLVRLIYEIFGFSSSFGLHIGLLYSELIPERWKDQVRTAVDEGSTKGAGTNNLWRELSQLCDVIIVDHNNESMNVRAYRSE